MSQKAANSLVIARERAGKRVSLMKSARVAHTDPWCSAPVREIHEGEKCGDGAIRLLAEARNANQNRAQWQKHGGRFELNVFAELMTTAL
jgi:hypothetical protein